MYEEDQATIERISQLQKAVQDLRTALHRERVNIQQQHLRSYAHCQVESPSSVTSDIQSAKTTTTKRQPSSLLQSHREEDDNYLELEAIELANFYKRKISEIEIECCAGLAQIRENFNEASTEFFDDIVDHDDRIIKLENATDEHLVNSEAYEELPSETNLAF